MAPALRRATCCNSLTRPPLYYYIVVPTSFSPNQLTYNIKVGDVTANWTVAVLTPGGWLSNSGSFSVQGSGNSTAPGAPSA